MQRILLCFLCLFSSCSSFKRKNNIIEARVTAYTHSEKDHLKYKKLNALGTNLIKNHSIATSWDRIPVGTLLKFNNCIYEVCDIGSALVRPQDKIPTIDLYVENKKEMKNWGVRFLNVEIIKMGSYAQSAEILKDRLRYLHCKVMYEKIQQKL